MRPTSLPGLRSCAMRPFVSHPILLVAALLLVIALWPGGSALAGPFGPSGDSSAQTTEQAGEQTNAAQPDDSSSVTPALQGSMGWVGTVLQVSARQQKKIKQSMAGYARTIRSHPGGVAFWSFLGLALVYGIFHALGPGHGKTVISAYCLGHGGGPGRAMLMGMVLSITHVGSATLLVAGVYLLFAKNMAEFQTAGLWLERASYLLLVCLGLGLTIQAIRGLWRNGADSSSNAATPSTWRGMLGTAFVTGLVPCPGATLILVFSLSLGIVETGFLSMAFLALGMGLTTGSFGLVATGARKLAICAAGTESRRAALLHAAFSLTGAVCITLFGTILLLGSLA